MRTGRRLRMVLDAESRQGAVFHAFDRVVVEVDVGDLDFVQVQLSGSTAKPWFCAVISTLLRSSIQNRMIRAVVAELQLVRPAAEGEAQDLVAQADSEDRLLAEKLPDIA